MLRDFTALVRLAAPTPIIAAMMVAITACALAGCGIKGPLRPAPGTTPATPPPATSAPTPSGVTDTEDPERKP